MIRPPAFWNRPVTDPGWQARMLAPLAAFYAAGTARRLARGARERVAVPVICVGNLNVGGTGKTPATVALLHRLAARGIAGHVLTRGYRGRLAGPVRVDPARHGVAEVGDEALLLAGHGACWLARDRAAGARAAQAAGAGAILLDDGFQNPALAYDLSVVVVDAARGFGNGRVLPAGPLREPVAVGLARADLIVAVGEPAAQAVFRIDWGAMVTVPVATAALVPLPTGMDWAGLRVVAFAGIGYPDKFFATLRGLGAVVLHAEPLADHQPLTGALLARLTATAARLGVPLVTTEKDAVRLPPGYRGQVLILPVHLQPDDWGPIDAALDRVFGTLSAKKSQAAVNSSD